MSEQEYTGGSVSYYTVRVTNPTTAGRAPYDAECNDIIEALDMTYAEGNAFKAVWRGCAARSLGKAKAGYDDGLYDAQKVEFFGARMVAMHKACKRISQVHDAPNSASPLTLMALDGTFVTHFLSRDQMLALRDTISEELVRQSA